jgi:hypothetical protein
MARNTSGMQHLILYSLSSEIDNFTILSLCDTAYITYPTYWTIKGIWRDVKGGTAEMRFLMRLSEYTLMDHVGRATAQAVSRRLPTAATRVRAQLRSSGICGGQRGTGAGFLRVLRFPLPIFIPPTAPHSSVIRGWYNRPVSGRSTKWTQSHPTPRKLKTKLQTMYAMRQYEVH